MSGRGGAAVVVSCEHGGNQIPPEYAHCFASPTARRALAGHRGWDPGSEAAARAFASALRAPLVVQRVSRLLVDCNRSLHHPRLFSEFSRVLGPEERNAVIERFWRTHRERVHAAVDDAPTEALVVHVGIHAFTPVWKGRRRATEVGLLFDPRRPSEAELARRWRGYMRSVRSRAIHLNRPYRGWTDGLTTTLRSVLPPDRYLGVELELSHALTAPHAGAVEAGLWAADGLRRALADLVPGD
ncbi:MAG: N-formylglutamate amidohydrolase [Longimicrobiales bacterium]|nr:N-formylglutamate amidohydrolase [Longimicrobiales bacterium]